VPKLLYQAGQDAQTATQSQTLLPDLIHNTLIQMITLMVMK